MKRCLWLNDHKVIREAWSNPACCGRPKMQGIVDRTAGFLGGQNHENRYMSL